MIQTSAEGDEELGIKPTHVLQCPKLSRTLYKFFYCKLVFEKQSLSLAAIEQCMHTAARKMLRVSEGFNGRIIIVWNYLLNFLKLKKKVCSVGYYSVCWKTIYPSETSPELQQTSTTTSFLALLTSLSIL